MKKFIWAIALILFNSMVCLQASERVGETVWTEASELTMVGKLMDTPNPYHRVDTVKYKGFTQSEKNQVISSSGLAVAFRTDSPSIWIQTDFGYRNRAANTMGMALRGYDLYVKVKGEWTYAASRVSSETNEENVWTLIKGMDGTMKEFLLYLPLYSEEYSIKLGTMSGARIEAIEPPFRHRVAIFGSSYTHGISCSRSGMTYPAQFARHTGIQLLSLGCSGNCKMQPYFADVLCDVPDVDAFIFDCFSNPSAGMIRERLFPFIEKIQAAHPGVPLIFQQTIYREGRYADSEIDRKEAAKMEAAEEMMKKAVKKYKDVYFIHPDAANDLRETSVDGIHPDNYGYTLWARSIEKPVLKILRRYGVK